MSSFMLATSVVIPLLIYMVVGGLIRRLGIMTVENFRAVNQMIFKVLIPLALFFDIYEAELGDVFRIDVCIFVFISLLISFSAVWLVMSRFVKDPARSATMIQGTFRSNYVLFGGTITASICGTAGTALAGAMASMTVPVINILSVITFEVKRGGSVDLKTIGKSILKNPIVDAGILGILIHLTPIRIPALIMKPLDTLGSLASPLALVCLGGILSFDSMAKHVKYLMSAVLGRLILIPAVFLAAAVLLGFRGEALVVIMAIFASPTAVASAPMAQAMGGDGELAGEIVVTTSTVCILTIFGFVWLLSSMGWI